MEATKQEYIVLYQNMMYTSTTLKDDETNNEH